MSIPTSISKRLRACMGCSLVKTQAQFREEGCDNCIVFGMKDNIDNVLDCTSDKFTGVAGILDTRYSWVSKWQHLDSFVPGMYALVIEGELPENKIIALEKTGRTYIPRDKSFVI
ncbi:transcription elongation factor SPT4 [Nematocida sp. AWRm80]|nr:transcription elongation factor SPT4 [Nematocida sp. AWRm80]